MKNQVQMIKEQEVLGKQFRVYGTFEEPLFLAKDVAEWIDYSKTSQGYYNVSKMLMTIDEDEKLTITNSNSGGSKVFLTEDGLYEVLMQSRKPIAKQFKKEVKGILKRIRQTGGYIPIQQEESDADILAKALLIAQRTIESKNKLLQEKENTINHQNQTINIITTNNTTFDEFERVVNAHVKAIATIKNQKVNEVWNALYSYLYDAEGMSLPVRAKNKRKRLNDEYFEKTSKHYSETTLKQKVSILSTVKESEYETVLTVVKSFAVKSGVDVTKITELKAS